MVRSLRRNREAMRPGKRRKNGKYGVLEGGDAQLK
jgi:hypothetical protein